MSCKGWAIIIIDCVWIMMSDTCAGEWIKISLSKCCILSKPYSVNFSKAMLWVCSVRLLVFMIMLCSWLEALVCRVYKLVYRIRVNAMMVCHQSQGCHTTCLGHLRTEIGDFVHVRILLFWCFGSWPAWQDSSRDAGCPPFLISCPCFRGMVVKAIVLAWHIEICIIGTICLMRWLWCYCICPNHQDWAICHCSVTMLSLLHPDRCMLVTSYRSWKHHARSFAQIDSQYSASVHLFQYKVFLSQCEGQIISRALVLKRLTLSCTKQCVEQGDPLSPFLFSIFGGDSVCDYYSMFALRQVPSSEMAPSLICCMPMIALWLQAHPRNLKLHLTTLKLFCWVFGM